MTPTVMTRTAIQLHCLPRISAIMVIHHSMFYAHINSSNNSWTNEWQPVYSFLSQPQSSAEREQVTEHSAEEHTPQSSTERTHTTEFNAESTSHRAQQREHRPQMSPEVVLSLLCSLACDICATLCVLCSLHWFLWLARCFRTHVLCRFVLALLTLWRHGDVQCTSSGICACARSSYTRTAVTAYRALHIARSRAHAHAPTRCAHSRPTRCAHAPTHTRCAHAPTHTCYAHARPTRYAHAPTHTCCAHARPTRYAYTPTHTCCAHRPTHSSRALVHRWFASRMLKHMWCK